VPIQKAMERVAYYTGVSESHC